VHPVTTSPEIKYMTHTRLCRMFLILAHFDPFKEIPVRQINRAAGERPRSRKGRGREEEKGRAGR